MDRYESLGLVGEGSYGTVLKCRHRDSGRLVAIKKFMDSDDDKTVKKIAQREIKLLRQLRHDNLVNLLEVWKRRRRWYLVFEFVERTLLDDLEQHPNGMDLETSRQCLYQILRAAAFCHQQNIIHRDIKPENILISQGGVVKLCDFGFARTMASPAEGGVYTDYVATRWYRAPELLVGDTKYGKPVDVWAIGCLLMEMLTGQPLFPGDSDLDQIYHIVRCFGKLMEHHQQLFYRNPVFSGVRLPECSVSVPLQQRYPTVTHTALHLTQCCLQMDPETRAQCSELLEHLLFTHDSFHLRFMDELNAKIQRDRRENSTLPKINKTPRREVEERREGGKEKRQPEDMEEKINKVKERREREEGEDRTAKLKGKDPSKPPKTIQQTSEPLMAIKQAETSGTKLVNNAAKAVMRSKPGKAVSRDIRKELEMSKTTKTGTSYSPEAVRTATSLKNNNTVRTIPKHGKVAHLEPREDSLRNKEHIKEAYSSKINSSNVKSSGLDCSIGGDDTKVLKTCKNSITEDPATSSSPRASLHNCQHANWTLTTSEVSSNNNTGVAAPSIADVTEYQTHQSTINKEQRGESGCQKVLSLNTKTVQTLLTSGATTSKNTASSPTKPSKCSDLSIQAATIHQNTTDNSCRTSNPKSYKVATSSDGRQPSDTSCTSHRPLKGQHTVVSMKSQEDASKASNKETNKVQGCLKTNQATLATTKSVLDVQILESKTILTSTSKSSHPSTPGASTTITPLKASGKENRVEQRTEWTTKEDVNQVSKGSNRVEREQSGNPEYSSNIIESQPPKATFPPGPKSENDKAERKDQSNASSLTDLTAVTTTSEHAVSRNSIHQSNRDTAVIENTVSHRSPPPPPCSTPLLFPPASTPLIPSIAVSGFDCGDPSKGAGLQPGTLSLRCIDKPKRRGGSYSRLTHQTPPTHITETLTAQSSIIRERSFLSSHGNLGNGGVAVAKRKSDVHFPDLRSATLPELRGRDGKHNKGATKDQRKHPIPSITQTEHQHGQDGGETHTP
ncbi:uncharacterized protein LOC143013931 [Genypterus blacodes]|uniref:uncharacterized protein LOC143013931 n=1 Tax=Genypterus blacodes TaxID=154954 RepID=UPI003F7697A4